MGIVHGRAQVARDFADLQAVSEAGVQLLWVAFNELADGYALDAELWAAILWDARTALPIKAESIPKEKFEQWCGDCFRVIDTDENGLIDALEVLAIICVLSTAAPAAKLAFLFTLYDFDARGALALDELALLVRTTSAGLVKVCAPGAVRKAPESTIERIAQNAFSFEHVSASARLPRQSFEHYFLTSCVEAEAWLAFFEATPTCRPEQQQALKKVDRDEPATSLAAAIDAQHVEPAKVSSKKRSRRRPRHWENSTIDLEPSNASEMVHDDSLAVPVNLALDRVLGFNRGVGVALVSPTPPKISSSDSTSSNSSTSSKHATSDIDEVSSNAERAVFATGSTVVLSSLHGTDNEKLTQAFYRGHTSNVSALATDGVFVASASSNEVHVWHAASGQLTRNLTIAGLMRAPSHVAFGPHNILVVCGRGIEPGSGYVAAVFDHGKASHHVFADRIVGVSSASGVAVASAYLFAVISRDANTPFVYERAENVPWRRRSAMLSGSFGESLSRRHGGLTSITCLVPDYLGADENTHGLSCFYTGSATGDLVEWVGRAVSNHLPAAHDGQVTALTCAGEHRRVVSCGSDGALKVWSHEFSSPVHVLQLGRTVTGLCFSFQSSMLVAEMRCAVEDSAKAKGTAGAKITRRTDEDTDLVMVDLHIDSPKPEPHTFTLMPSLRKAHFQSLRSSGELVNMRPQGLYKGGPRTAGVQIPLKPQLQDGPSGEPPAFTITKCGKLLAFAQQGDVLLYAMRAAKRDAAVVARLQDFKNDTPTALCFSPDTQTLIAVLPGDASIFVYDVGELRIQLERANLNNKSLDLSDLIICRGKISIEDPLAAAVTGAAADKDASAKINIDFSDDARFARIEFVSAKVIVFVDIRAATTVADIATLKDLAWDSFTCTFAWGAHGAWADIDGKHDLCATCVLAPSHEPKTKLLCAGTNAGTLEVRRWPCTSRKKAKKMTNATSAYSKAVSQVLMLGTAEAAEGGQTSLASFEADLGSYFVWRIEPQASASNATPGISHKNHETADVDGDPNEVLETKGETAAGEEKEEKELEVHQDPFAQDPIAYLWRDLIESGEIAPPTKNGKAKPKKKAKTKARQLANKDAPLWFTELEEQPPLAGPDYAREAPSSLTLETVHGVGHVLRSILYASNERTGRFDLVYPAGELVIIVDPEQGTQKHVSVGSRITCVSSRCVHNLVAVGCENGQVALVNIKEPNVIAQLPDCGADGGPVWAVALASSGRHLAVCAGKSRRELQLWPVSGCVHGPVARQLLPPFATAVIGLEFRSCPPKEEKQQHQKQKQQQQQQQQEQQQQHEAIIAFGEEFACILSHVNQDYLRVSGLYQVPGTAILSVQVLSTGLTILGDAAGHLHICDAQTLSPRGVLERAHARSITAVQEIAQTKDLVSAGADGFVKVWQIPADVEAASISSLDPKLMIDTSTLTNCLKATPSIYGLSTSPYGMANKHNRAVVALSLGQILQIDLETGLGIGEGVLTQGFGAAAGSGCAGCHPFKSDVVCAAGADRWLTLHRSGAQTLRVPLDGAARSLTWSPDGCHVAVGMTGSFVAVYSVDEGNVTRIFEQGDPGAGGGAKGKKIGVAQVRYSQDGRLLGYISGNKIYIALVDEKSNTYETFAELEDGDSLLVAMEFTQNSKFVRAVDTNGKLVEMDVRAQAPMREKAKRKAQWIDRAVPAGADIRSLWIADETTQIVAMRSFHDDAETMLVLGSAPHVVRASHLPLPGTKDPLAGYSGFPAGPPGSVICSIVVSPRAKRVVTTDDITGTLRVWRLDPPRPAAAAELESGTSLQTFSLGGKNCEGEKGKGDEQDEEAHSETENDEIDTANLDDLIAAQFSVAQDWIDHEDADTESRTTRDMARDHMNLSQDALREASKTTRPIPLHERGQITGAPQIKMELEHVFGRVSAGSGPFLTREGALVSTAGRFGLESSLLGERLQTHLYVAPASETFSICETTALAVCPRVGLAATAACVNNDTSALVRVWHTGSCSSVAVHNFETGVRVVSLAFSEDAQRLAGVILSSTGSAELFVLCAPACEDGQGVWLEVSKSGFLEMAAPLHVRPQPGVWCAFVGRYSVVVGGSEFLCIARDVRKRQAGGLVCYGTPKPSEGAVQSDHSRVVFTCGAGLAEPQIGIVGDNCGSLLVYENGRRSRTIRHACEENAYIRAAASCPETSCFVTGDSRGILRVLSSSLEALHTLNHTIDLTACDVQFEDRSRITSVDVDRHCSRIVVGMASGEIVLASPHTGGASLVEAPQCPGESFGATAGVQAWAMTVNPSNPDHVCVTSDDGFVRVWDLATKELVACEEIDQDGPPAAIRAAAWSPDGLLIAIGYGRESEVANKAKAGAFAVLNATTLDVAYHGRDSKEWITDAKFSPTGTHLALASMDGHVYVYDARNGFKLHYVSENLKTGVLAIDYAGSSLFLRATTQDVRHVVLNATSGEPVEDEEKTKDQNWTTSECMTSWGFGGFAGAEIPGGSVLPLCTAREKTLNVALAGGSHGTVQLANFPYLTTARNGEAERFKSMAAHSGAVSRILTVPSAASDLAASDSAAEPSQKNKLPTAGVAKILTLGSRDCVLLEWKLVVNSS